MTELAAEPTYEEGHLDLSFRTQEGWQSLQYGERVVSMPPNYILVGHPECGPMLSVSAISPHPESAWAPAHSHATDQFRVVLRGVTPAVNNNLLGAREFSFQEAGMLYREGIGGPDDDVWMAMLVGDRRGAALIMPNATAPGDAAAGTDLDRMAESNPDGAEGVPRVATTVGVCRRGYLEGSFADTSPPWSPLREGVEVAVGVVGDPEHGPVVLLLKGEPGHVVVPAHTSGAETFSIIVSGSGAVGDAEYETGDMRLQGSGVAFEPILAGPEGLELVFILTDRSASFAIDEVDAEWQRVVEELVDDVRSKVAARS